MFKTDGIVTYSFAFFALNTSVVPDTMCSSEKCGVQKLFLTRV